MTKICIVTACGKKKESIAMPAWKLYKSSRIRALYDRKGNYDMYILSAEHAMLPAEKITEPYDRIMDINRSQELIPKVKEIVKKYDSIVYFRAGASRLYEQCLKSACEQSNVKLISYGYNIMGDFGKLGEKIREAEKA